MVLAKLIFITPSFDEKLRLEAEPHAAFLFGGACSISHIAKNVL
jgi:hypothetical protein